jgi:hypothetical protein
VDHERIAAQRDELLAQRELRRALLVEGLRSVLEPDVPKMRVPIDVAVAMIESAIVGAHPRADRLLPTLPAFVVADALVHGLVGALPENPAPGQDS